MTRTTAAQPLTKKNLADQSDKVFLVTGATGGIGELLADLLYGANAKVYIAARNPTKASATIDKLRAQNPDSKGTLVFLKLDLDDLTTIKASAEEFLSKEDKLDVLWNNAGVMVPPAGSKTKQGYELQLGTNCVAPFLFTKLLLPLLIKTAKASAPQSVRIIWVSSQATWRYAPTGGVEMDNLDYKSERNEWQIYGASKAGNVFHANEFARRYKDDGVVSVSLEPGLLKTDLYATVSWWQNFFMSFILKDPIIGANTELFAGLSPEVDTENLDTWIIPESKITPLPRKDLLESCKRKSEGGTGIAEDFYNWTEEQIKSYL